MAAGKVAENKEKPASTAMPTSYEQLLQLVGSLGAWQYSVYAMLAYSQFLGAIGNIVSVFMKVEPDYWCEVESDDWLKGRLDDSALLTNVTSDNECYNYNEKAFAELLPNATLPQPHECEHFQFATNGSMRRTLVNDFGLVCSKKMYFEHSQMVFMLGYMIGSLVGGFLADIIGRKWASVLMVCGKVCFGLLQAFMPPAWGFVPFLAVRFLLACSSVAAWMPQAALGVEITSPKWRTLVGGGMFLPFSFGYAFTAVLTYWTRDWRHTVAIATGPLVVSIVLYLLFLPESPRWLLAKNRVAEAEAVMRRAARLNGRTLPDGIDFGAIADALGAENAKRQTMAHVFQLRKDSRMSFAYPTLVARTLCLFFLWLVNSMVYYGVSLNVSDFAGSVFVNNFIAGIVEVPAVALTVVLMHWGRRPAEVLGMAVAGISLFAIPWIGDMQWLSLVLVMCGKFGISVAFNVIYPYTLELYPTVIRASSLSSCSSVARIGSMLAPYISGLGKLFESAGDMAPMYVYGVFSIAAAVLSFTLPETKSIQLPEYIEQAAEIHRAKDKRQAVAPAKASNRVDNVTNVDVDANNCGATSF